MRKLVVLSILLVLALEITAEITATAQEITIGGKTYYYNPASGTYVPYPVVKEETINPQTIKPQATTTSGTATVSSNRINLTTPSVPVALWSVGYNTYTAQFIGEDKVVVYTTHGDMDLGYRYISVHPYGSAYIYDTKTGKLLKSFSGGATYDLATGTKVWSRSGFFSGNGQFLVEDPQYYGTNARVVDLSTGTTYPINWTGTAGSYYACQMDYYGQYIAVGEQVASPHVIVFKREGNTYEKYWISPVIPDEGISANANGVRRLFLTLDAKYLIYGSIDNHYLYIAENNGNGYTIIAKIPLAGGVGALTCTDPWNVGLILVGTSNGHIYIFDTHNGTKIADPDLVIHLNSSQTGTTGRFYNPFYNRWNPAHITAVAFSTSTDPYVSIIIDLTTGRYFRFSGSGYGKATAISLQGNYIFAGRTLYLLVKQDIQSGKPRIRFHGDLIYNPTQSHPWELNTAFVLKAPKNKPYHVYFESGKIKITYVSSDERPVQLIQDKDIKRGLLGKMLDKGLVRYDVIYTDGASVENQKIEKFDNPQTPEDESDRAVIYTRTHVFHTWTWARFFGVNASTADSGVIIEIPLNTKVTPYTDLRLEPKFAVTVVVPQFNPVGELIGVGGQTIAGAGMLATAKSLGSGWLRDYLIAKGFDELAVRDAVSMFSRVATRVGSKLLTIVGLATLVDAGMEFYTHYENLKMYENIVSTVYVIPIMEDTKTGEKYAVVDYILPAEAKPHENDYRQHVISYLKKIGIPPDHVGVRFTYPVGIETWKDYFRMIGSGNLPKPNLVELAKDLIPQVPTDRLKIDKIVIVIDTITQGYASTFDLLGGGYKMPVATIVYGDGFQVTGILPKFETGDPEEIASLIPKVEINGKLYDVNPSTDGAIAVFSLPIGTDSFILKFPNAQGMRAWFSVDLQTLVKCDMVDKGGYYEAKFHYDWKYDNNNLCIITKRMEFVDVPYPMVYAERTIKLLHGRVEWLEIDKYFELSKVIDDQNSPTGKRYYYVTENPVFLDPSNGARMQTCKTYIFRYWYVAPPRPYKPPLNTTIPINNTIPLPNKPNITSPIGNAWVKLYLNGTLNASVVPRQLVVWLGSTGTANNTINVKINMRAGYLDNKDRPVYTLNKTVEFTKTLKPNTTYTQFYDIQKFIAEAISHAPRGFFEAETWITKATYDKIKADDYDRVVYFPPPTIPPTGSPVSLKVRVLNILNQTPVAGATVYLDGSLFGTTDANGWVNGSTATGLHTIKVEANGYDTYVKDYNIFDNMTLYIWLTPTSLPATYHLLEVLVQYKDGAPYEGANVTVKDNTTGTVLFTQETDSLGLSKFLIDAGKTVDIHITAGNYTFNFTGIVMNKDQKVVATVPENSKYFVPEVGLINATIKIHWGQGWFYGKTPHLVEIWAFTNVPQTITITLRAFDEQNNTLDLENYTYNLHQGVNYLMAWVKLGVRNETKNVTVEATITKYQYDTNPYNNKVTSNTVMIKPFVDLSVTVLWKPIKQKTMWAILPEDIIEVCIGYMIPCKLHGIKVKANIMSDDLYKHEFKSLKKLNATVSSNKPNTTIWYNYTVVVPFTDKIVVNASIYHPWEYMGWNNNISVTIPVFEDTKLCAVSLPILVSAGQKLDVKFHIKTNAIGEGVTLSVADENTGDLIGSSTVTIKEPEFDAYVPVTAPQISGFYETHTWNATANAVDYYEQNNFKTLSVSIWNVPWWFWIVLILIGILFVLSFIKALLTTIQKRAMTSYRFFKRRETTKEYITLEEFITKRNNKDKKFRFFRRLK